MTEEHCWACGAEELAPFFHVEQMALSSLILVDSREEALEFPTGEIEVVVCANCGFIFNRAFRPELVDYTMPYESSQVFSPRFRSFADELIAHLVSSYELEGKEILEIGCGDASFLQELCRAASARGLGIDPTFDSARIAEDVAVTGMAEFFDKDHTHITGDLICCRHTLEHIQPVAEFVRLVAQSADNRPGCTVFFEIPDADRILDEGAFWDIYNEHCSYFTVWSLSYLFRSQGFEILSLRKGFDDQYLLIDCKRGEEDLSIDRTAVDALVHKARSFGEMATDELLAWREQVDATIASGGKVVLWGASSKAVAFLAALQRDGSITAAVDINPFKQDKYLPGSATFVIPPEQLIEVDPDLVIIMNPIYVTEIRESLSSLGLSPRVAALGAQPESAHQ